MNPIRFRAMIVCLWFAIFVGVYQTTVIAPFQCNFMCVSSIASICSKPYFFFISIWRCGCVYVLSFMFWARLYSSSCMLLSSYSRYVFFYMCGISDVRLCPCVCARITLLEHRANCVHLCVCCCCCCYFCFVFFCFNSRLA